MQATLRSRQVIRCTTGQPLFCAAWQDRRSHRKPFEPFDLTSHMDASYPPVYLTANEDDHTAPFSNSLTVAETCEKLGIPHKTRFGKTGDHGFGLGIGLEVEGWLKEAVSFWEEVR